MITFFLLVGLQSASVMTYCLGADSDSKQLWPGYVTSLQSKCLADKQDFSNSLEISWKPPRGSSHVQGYEIAYQSIFKTHVDCVYTNANTTNIRLNTNYMFGDKIFISVRARPTYIGLSTVAQPFDICKSKHQANIVSR